MTFAQRLSTFRLFLQKNWFILFLITLAILITVSFIFRLITPPLPPTSESNSWREVTPGYTKLDQVQEKLGAPVGTNTTTLGRQVTFESDYPMIPNQVFVDDEQTVQLIKEATPADVNENIIDYQQRFGAADAKLYSESVGELNAVHLYFSEGFGVVARETDGGVEAKWYFVPMTGQEFITKWGAGLETTPHEAPEFIPQ